MSNRKERNGKGRTLTLFLINDWPDGMVTAELSNWPGHILTIPRMQLKEGLDRPKTSYPGVYLLRGEDEEGSCFYIGEAENVGQRVRNHVDSDWWNNVVIITTKDNSLNKAHAQYLEARLIEIARRTGRGKIKNNNTPARPTLSEAEQANMESFLEDLQLVLPFLRIDGFTDDTRPNSPLPVPDAPSGGSGTGESQTFVLYMPQLKIRAIAKWGEDGKFVVLKGSQARSEWTGARHPSYTDLFNHLCDIGVLKLAEDGPHRVFTENYAFNSMSAAGSVVTGYPCNGPASWKPE